jgi:hypothetical protein
VKRWQRAQQCGQSEHLVIPGEVAGSHGRQAGIACSCQWRRRSVVPVSRKAVGVSPRQNASARISVHARANARKAEDAVRAIVIPIRCLMWRTVSDCG